VRILAVSTAERSALLPNVPTLKESGIDVEADAWMGLIGPAGLSPATVDHINQLVRDVLTSPAIREKLAAQLMEPVPDTPADFRARISADLARWKPVIETAHIRIN
jgi:tripartite-type tricarboxylate transporter receptor subunit TctC